MDVAFVTEIREALDRRPSVFISDALARAADPELDRLMIAEENLGDLRWCKRVEFGGSHPEVDRLYDEMNDRLMATKTDLARDAVLGLGSEVAVDLAEVAKSSYFSRNAGCEACPCTPGVVAPGLRRDGRAISVFVELETR